LERDLFFWKRNLFPIFYKKLSLIEKKPKETHTDRKNSPLYI